MVPAVVVMVGAIVAATSPAVFAAPACSGPPQSTAAVLNAAFSHPIGSWQAGDVPQRYPLPDGRVLWVLNDSFVNATAPGGGLTASSVFVHNAAVVQQGTCFTPVTGPPADSPGSVTAGPPVPTSFLGVGETTQQWWWFHGGMVIGDELRVVVSQMRQSGPVGWTIAFGPTSTWVAIYDWRTLQLRGLAPAPDSGVPIYGFSLATDGAWTYLFGQADELRFPAGSKVNTVARVPRGALGARPQYWDGTTWQDDAGRAISISTNGTWNHRMRVVFTGERWIAVAKEDDFFGADAIVLEAPVPEGPWVVTMRVPAPPQRPGDTVTYDATPLYAPIGDTLTIVWSNNVLDFALAAADPSLYRPTFTDLTLPPPTQSNPACRSSAPGGQAVTAMVGGSGDVPVPGRPSSYVPVSPTRLVDTRTASKIAPTGGTVTVVDIARAVGAAPGELTAAVLNVTATAAVAPGHVTVWPGAAPRPLASSLNVDKVGATVANLVTVAVGADGTVALASNIATHLVVDLAGVYRAAPDVVAAGRFMALTPARLLDTRDNGNLPPPASTVAVPVLGRAGVPAAGVAAVVITVTGTQAASDGFASVWGDGGRPSTSSLNLGRGGTRANQVIVPVGADGAVRVFTQPAAHLVVDVAGWFTDASATPSLDGRFVPVAPVRLLDSRAGAGRPAGGCVARVTMPLAAAGARGVVVNLTTTETTRAGFLTVWPAGGARPTASNLNADAADETRPVHAVAALGPVASAGAAAPSPVPPVPVAPAPVPPAPVPPAPVPAAGAFDIFQQHGGHLVVDLAGWFT